MSRPARLRSAQPTRVVTMTGRDTTTSARPAVGAAGWSVRGVVLAALLLGAAACSSPEASAIVKDSEPVTTEAPTTDPPPTTESSTTESSTTTTPGTTDSGPPSTSGATIPGDDFGCPARGDTSLFPCDDDDPTDNIWHVGSCLTYLEDQDAYGEAACAGATNFIKELAQPLGGAAGECFFDHVATVELTDEELQVSGPDGGPAAAGSIWCVSDP